MHWNEIRVLNSGFQPQFFPQLAFVTFVNILTFSGSHIFHLLNKDGVGCNFKSVTFKYLFFLYSSPSLNVYYRLYFMHYLAFLEHALPKHRISLRQWMFISPYIFEMFCLTFYCPSYMIQYWSITVKPSTPKISQFTHLFQDVFQFWCLLLTFCL